MKYAVLPTMMGLKCGFVELRSYWIWWWMLCCGARADVMLVKGARVCGGRMSFSRS